MRLLFNEPASASGTRVYDPADSSTRLADARATSFVAL